MFDVFAKMTDLTLEPTDDTCMTITLRNQSEKTAKDVKAGLIVRNENGDEVGPELIEIRPTQLTFGPIAGRTDAEQQISLKTKGGGVEPGYYFLSTCLSYSTDSEQGQSAQFRIKPD